MPCIAAAKALCEPGTFTMISCKGQPLSSLDNPKVPALPRLFQASGSAPARSSDDAPRRKLGPAIRIGSTPIGSVLEAISSLVVGRFIVEIPISSVDVVTAKQAVAFFCVPDARSTKHVRTPLEHIETSTMSVVMTVK